MHERIDPYVDKNVMNLSRLGHIKRYKKATEFIAEGHLVLDAGCGYGYGSNLLAEHAPKSRVIGIDKSSYAIKYARERYGENRKQYFVGDLESFDISKFGPFDLITFFEVIEHLKNPSVVLKKLRNQISPCGHLLLSTPNGRFRTNNPHHKKEYTEQEIRELLHQNGFEVKEILCQYPLIGSLLELARKMTGYNLNTDKEFGFISKLIDSVPLLPETFSGIYEGRAVTASAADLYFITKPRV